MSKMIPLMFKEHQLRFVGTADKPEWVASDVVTLLYRVTNKRDLAKYLDTLPSEWKGSWKSSTLLGKKFTVVTVFEPGLYSLVARSENPIAAQFLKWMVEEVLPSIRETGTYIRVLPPDDAPQKATGIIVSKHEGVSVVDSRLIAERLEVEHDNFLQTLQNYQTHIEQAFGILLFQTGKIEGRGRPSKYALLTEDQATFVMTLSRNTPEVVQCKIELVQAFSKAKALLYQRHLEPIPAPTFEDYVVTEGFEKATDLALRVAGEPGAEAVKAFVAMVNNQPTTNIPPSTVDPNQRVYDRIIATSRRKGAIDAAEAQRGLRSVDQKANPTSEIRKKFQTMAAQGLGTVSGEGTRLMFTANKARE